MEIKNAHPRLRWLATTAATTIMMVVLFDILSAYALFYFFEVKGSRSPSAFYSVDGHFPSVWAARKFYSAVYSSVFPYSASWPRLTASTDNSCPTQVTPKRPFQADPVYGRSIRPGNYTIVYCPTGITPRKSYRWTMSVEPDGGRRTGYERKDIKRRLLLLGDSYIFGWGLNDEQTAAWLLQGYFANQYNVKNLASGGWGTTEQLITVRKLADSLGPEDVLVLGYGHYYKIRNVAAPSRIREETTFSTSYEGIGLSSARARISGPSVSIDFVRIDCSRPETYCNQPDPPQSVIDATAIALYREIIDSVRSHVAVLHLSGPEDDPVLDFFTQRKIPIIDGRPTRSQYYMDDDVAGYDTHPGPMTNYAWYTMLRAFIEANWTNGIRSISSRQPGRHGLPGPSSMATARPDQ